MDDEDKVRALYDALVQAHNQGTLAEQPPTVTKKQLSLVYKKIDEAIEKAESDYQKDVKYWSEQASSDALFGHYSQSMVDYYDNEVIASARGLRDSVKNLQDFRKALIETYQR